MRTLGTKVNDDMYQRFLELSDVTQVTVSENLRNLIEKSLTKKSDHMKDQGGESSINHILSCPDCQIVLADKGFITMPIEMYNKIRHYI
ncbi:hypothetical protein [Candidatus Nitrosotalea okcheonensis]|uniref:Uncharacterized protein n=1 Tax=Candidatus Nitrosotalea okcheonensis TaxID=1903276 RepID=A0A2H1FC48_9ARCH|nr:hypothetical protein [Candidatus Nitrosotalea okcheonensis]SMH70343.1 protein of unknown function [Candidatus Nitrosotalea okcheonensis]